MDKTEDIDITEENKSGPAESNGNGANSAAAPEAEFAQLLAAAENAAKEAEKKYLYLSAEFDNYRKRMQKEKTDFFKWGHEDFLRDQLQILDNFERAVQYARSANPEKQSPFGQLLQGVEMISHQFADSLKRQGVAEIKAVGEKFDPLLHEAVAEEESETAEPGAVLKELQKGYLLHGRLLRASKVVTSRRPG